MRAKDAVGRYGEDVAARFLQSQGWHLLERNWRGESGEIDIVAMTGSTLVIVEVKTRRSVEYGHPAEAVTPRKLARLRRLAAQWLDAHRIRAAEVRVDIVSVLLPRQGGPQVEHWVGVV